MEKSKRAVKLPALIFRDEKGIEAEIAATRSKREEIANTIKALGKSLSDWKGKPDSFEWVLGFALADEYEIDLLEYYQNKNSIPATVRLEKIKEVYNVPDFSHIVAMAKTLFPYGNDFLFSFLNGGNVLAPEVTKEEKEAIIEKHSTYILTEKTWQIYSAIVSLCDYANKINFEVVENGQRPNKILKSRLASAVPHEYTKFLEWEQPEDGTERKKFVPNYERFKNG
jgi:hypothetical protein